MRRVEAATANVKRSWTLHQAKSMARGKGGYGSGTGAAKGRAEFEEADEEAGDAILAKLKRLEEDFNATSRRTRLGSQPPQQGKISSSSSKGTDSRRDGSGVLMSPESCARVSSSTWAYVNSKRSMARGPPSQASMAHIKSGHFLAVGEFGSPQVRSAAHAVHA